jgi:hypothetical protein
MDSGHSSSGPAFERPQWLDDEPEIVGILGLFLDRLNRAPAEERRRGPSIRLSEKTAPGLFRHDAAADRSWALLRSLEGGLFEIRLNRKRSFYDAEYVGASLKLLEGGEAVCRAWLGQPRTASYRDEWLQAIEAHALLFADGGEALRRRAIHLGDSSAGEVVAAFAQVAEHVHEELTLRQLSARCFRGHSKFLDGREALLRELFPQLRIAPRPVLVQVRLPSECAGVLFVENLDSYIQLIVDAPSAVDTLAVVYAAGFRGGAERIRTRGGAALHYYAPAGDRPAGWFESWWFSESGVDQPVWFWGDLDYAGMSILRALRQNFPAARAWQPGYAALLDALERGMGHAPELSDKTEQPDPGVTGCAYADRELLPAMRRCGRFVDQELIRL